MGRHQCLGGFNRRDAERRGCRDRLLSGPKSPRRILTFGEALIDVYPDRSVVAGAPLHVAVHLANRGWTSYLMTRLGGDDHGARVRGVLERCGVEPALVETDRDVPTGTVSIGFDPGGDHTFTIHRPAAWDGIEGPEAWDGLDGPASLPPHDVLHYGTLAGRSPTSRRTLHRVLKQTDARLRVFDVNLRPPDVDAGVVRTGLASATLVKLNQAELEEAASQFGIEPAVTAYFDAAPNLEWVCVTRGPEGAELHARDGRSWSVDAPRVVVTDTVGAGDSFTAGLIEILGAGGGPLEALDNGRNLAGTVLSSRGALPPCASAEAK